MLELIEKNIEFKYSRNFIIKLSRKLAKQYPDHKFKSEKSFVVYMVKALQNEKRALNEANRVDFCFNYEIKEIKQFEIINQYRKQEYQFVTGQILAVFQKIEEISVNIIYFFKKIKNK
jgi:hypothetical protein